MQRSVRENIALPERARLRRWGLIDMSAEQRSVRGRHRAAPDRHARPGRGAAPLRRQPAEGDHRSLDGATTCARSSASTPRAASTSAPSGRSTTCCASWRRPARPCSSTPRSWRRCSSPATAPWSSTTDGSSRRCPPRTPTSRRSCGPPTACRRSRPPTARGGGDHGGLGMSTTSAPAAGSLGMSPSGGAAGALRATQLLGPGPLGSCSAPCSPSPWPSSPAGAPRSSSSWPSRRCPTPSPRPARRWPSSSAASTSRWPP